jgi:hypothetical protein
LAFSNGQNVQAADLNNFSVTTVTTTGAVSVGGTLGVTGASTVAALTASGTVTAQGLIDASGAGAGQLKFPAVQNASTNANTLDDYEEGLSSNSWVPVIGGSGGTSGQAYAAQIGTYIKVGRLVIAWFDVTLSTLGTVTTVAQIQGLPFTAANVGAVIGSTISFWAGTSSNFVQLSPLVIPNTTTANLFGATAAGATLANVVQADLSNTTRLVGVLVYPATA